MHGDESFISFQQTFMAYQAIASKLTYTGMYYFSLAVHRPSCFPCMSLILPLLASGYVVRHLKADIQPSSSIFSFISRLGQQSVDENAAIEEVLVTAGGGMSGDVGTMLSAAVYARELCLLFAKDLLSAGGPTDGRPCATGGCCFSVEPIIPAGTAASATASRSAIAAALSALKCPCVCVHSKKELILRLASSRWRLLVGYSVPEDTIRQWQLEWVDRSSNGSSSGKSGSSTPGTRTSTAISPGCSTGLNDDLLVLERARPDFPELLNSCSVCVCQVLAAQSVSMWMVLIGTYSSLDISTAVMWRCFDTYLP